MDNQFFFAEHHEKLQERLTNFINQHRASLDLEREDEDQHAKEIICQLADAGLLKLVVPASFGGEFEPPDVRSICLARERLCYISGLADLMFAMQGLGSYAITLAGSEQQKQEYLPKVASGEYIAAFAITEPNAGSDTGSMQTTAIKDGDDYILNGTKRFISNAGIASFYTLFAKTDPTLGNKGVSAFVVNADTPGITIKKLKLISPHPIGELTFNDCRISSSQLLGEPGQGFKLAMRVLDTFRASVGAMALGMGTRALDEAISYAKNRIQFNRPLSELQATQFKLAEIATELDAARLLVYRAAWLKDQGGKITREAAMAKLFATESAQRAVDQAVQIHGGSGLVHGVITERLYRDIRSTRIYEGTSEIQKIVIASQILK
ncbi:MAG: acyl-CoA dehydrogenase family protein [Blastocatellia bacterium]|nr:acyl-CoA dehydrogenase family protein [Blastocatellia bacterium]MBL8196176.1 acyl-CoA dehydrogenase family protein [Blastocatellia bacterium]